MKIRAFILLFILSMTSFYLRADNCCDRSHTFFVPRQITTNSVFELALNNYHWYHERPDDENFHFGFYGTLFFQQSTKSKNIARYFLRGEQECLNFHEVNEDPDAIESLWFGLESDVNTNFNATFSMNPRRRAFGSCFNLLFAKQWNYHSALWFNIVFTVMRADHKLRMCECVEELDGPLSNFELGTIDEFTSVICALNNPEWCFGRFSDCTLKRTGVDDIQLKLGYDWYYSEKHRSHVSPYLVGTIPTGQRQRSKFIFEPLVGSKNGSVGAGINTDVRLWASDSQSLAWLVDLKYRFVFSARQCRSFDLCVNGDWSRYLLVVPQDQHLATEPGINLFSLSAKVQPGSTIDFWTALHWQCDCCSLNVEIGYDFWWRQKEKICLKNCLPEGFGIFDIAGASDVPQTASTANISQGPTGTNKAVSDVTFVELETSDLNLDSAAHPHALSSTFYAAFGWAAFGWHASPPDHPVLIDFGAQYEIAHNKAALSQWAVWTKVGIVF